jgi:glucose/arabinose dehydrogenase
MKSISRFSYSNLRLSDGWRLGFLGLLVLALVGSTGTTWAQNQEAQRTPNLVLQLVTNGVAGPISMAHAGDGTGRLFIVQQEGEIRIWTGSTLLATPFLDISALAACCGERGLLGLAFHPNYSSNGLFYVHYTNNSGNTVIAEYAVSAGDPNVANGASGDIILTQSQPFSNHNGGQIAFGPDGYLYIGLGDGGSGGDPLNSGQTLTTQLGKILRIDVDGDDFPGDANRDYAIPATNPFVGNPSALDEIWAYGLRNPWRFSFDSMTGDLFIADVGQGAIEEIDFQPAGSAGGLNYGWRRMEGDQCFNPSTGCDTGSLEYPILQYGHSSGRCSVTGGFRYRGSDYPNLQGYYFYADYCTGEIWGATPDQNGDWLERYQLNAPFNITTFGEDEDGEVYVANYGGGEIYRLTDTSAADAVFDDTFEGGDLSQWDSSAGAEDLAVTATAALEGSMGLEVTVDDLDQHYVVDETPNAEEHYRARFRLDPNSLTMEQNKRHKLLTAFSNSPSRRLLTLVFRGADGTYYLLAKGHNDDNSWAKTAWIDLGDQPVTLEVEWLKATSTNASDGVLRLWVDDVLQDTLTGLDFDDGSVDFVRFGVVGGLDTGTLGTFYLDSFASRRHNYIGEP